VRNGGTTNGTAVRGNAAVGVEKCMTPTRW
jgi:hypothetical protein